MKLRLRRSSIRLRLTHGELSKFAETGVVEEVVDFGIGPNERFRYRVVSDPAKQASSAKFEADGITVTVPADAAAEWAATEQVGIVGEMNTGGGQALRILVEKDFACLRPRAGEEDLDAFPHPVPKMMADDLVS
ncbi:hypothetical protein BH20ACI2_BH20ACI2_25120 [soil metagenome]